MQRDKIFQRGDGAGDFETEFGRVRSESCPSSGIMGDTGEEGINCFASLFPMAHPTRPKSPKERRDAKNARILIGREDQQYKTYRIKKQELEAEPEAPRGLVGDGVRGVMKIGLEAGKGLGRCIIKV